MAMEIDKEISSAEQWYPTFDEPKPKSPLVGRPPREERLRPGLEPGTVVIVLTGKFRGRRMIFLKELAPGFLLLNGPYCVNKVPLLKMKQDLVIITSTKIPVPELDLSDVTMDYFVKPKKSKREQSQAEFFQAADDEKPKLSEEVVATQKKIDSALMSSIDEEIVQYLRTPFTLYAGDRPHLMKF
eukprot:g2355.t1